MQSNQNLPLANLISMASENASLFEKTWSSLDPAVLKSLVLSKDNKGNPILSHYTTSYIFNPIFEKLDDETKYEVLKMQNSKGDTFLSLIAPNKDISNFPLTDEQWEALIFSTNNKNKNILENLVSMGGIRQAASLIKKLSPKRIGQLIEGNDANFIALFVKVFSMESAGALLKTVYENYWQYNNIDLNQIWRPWPILLDCILYNDYNFVEQILKTIPIDVMCSMIESNHMSALFIINNNYHIEALTKVFFTYPLKMLALNKNWRRLVSEDAGTISNFYTSSYSRHYMQPDSPKFSDYNIFQLLIPTDINQIKEPLKWLDMLERGLLNNNLDIYHSVSGRLLLAINPDNLNESCKHWLKIKNINVLSKEESLLISYKLNDYSQTENLSSLQLMEINYHLDEHKLNIVNKADIAEEKSIYPDFPHEAFAKKKSISKESLIALAINYYSELVVRCQNLHLEKEQTIFKKFNDLISTVPINLKQSIINIFKTDIKSKEALELISEFENVISTLQSLDVSNANLSSREDIEWSSFSFLINKDKYLLKTILPQLDPVIIDKLIVQNATPSLVGYLNKHFKYGGFQDNDNLKKIIANTDPSALLAAFQLPDVIKLYADNNFDYHLFLMFQRITDPKQRLVIFEILDEIMKKYSFTSEKAKLYFKFHPNIHNFSSVALERLFVAKNNDSSLLINIIRHDEDYAFKIGFVKKLDKGSINTILQSCNCIFDNISKGYDEIAHHIINVGDDRLVLKHLQAMDKRYHSLNIDSLTAILARKNPEFYHTLLLEQQYRWETSGARFNINLVKYGFLTQQASDMQYFRKLILSYAGLAFLNKPDKYFNYTKWSPLLYSTLDYAKSTPLYEKFVNTLCQIYLVGGQAQLIPPLLLEINNYKNVPQNLAATWSDLLRVQSKDPKIAPLQRLNFTLKAIDFLEASVGQVGDVKANDEKADNLELNNNIDTLGNALLYSGFFVNTSLDEKVENLHNNKLNIAELHTQKIKFLQDFKKTMEEEFNQNMKEFGEYLQDRKAKTRSYTSFLLGSSVNDYVLRENYFTALGVADTTAKKLEIVAMALEDKKITGGKSHKAADILRKMKLRLEAVVEVNRVEGKIGIGLKK